MQQDSIELLEQRILDWAQTRTRQSAYYAKIPQALEFAKGHHNGFREDGSPEFGHQLWIADQLINVLKSCEAAGASPMPNAPDALMVALCHDILEDTPVTLKQLGRIIGERAAVGVHNISYKYRDEKTGELIRKDKDEAHRGLYSDPLALMDKFIDRAHNLRTMFDVTADGVVNAVVYDPKKQLAKLREATLDFLPAGEEEALAGRFGDTGKFPLYDDPAYAPYILGAREVLVNAVSWVSGMAVAADMKRTHTGWTNEEQREKLMSFLELVRFPADEMRLGQPLPPRPTTVWERLAKRFFRAVAAPSSHTPRYMPKKGPAEMRAGP